jgi:hypothetical protein
VDHKSLRLSGRRVVDLLSMAEPPTVDLLPVHLISPTILYLASLILFPSEADLDKPVDYKAHYYANHRVFFIIFSLWTPVDIVDSLLKGWAHFLELGITYDVSGVLFFTGLVMAAITRNETYHKIYSVFFLLQTVWISWTLFRTLI